MLSGIRTGNTARGDAVIVGSGPNGMAAAIALAAAGMHARVLEASEALGGGTRSAQLTLPGYIHDVCSAVHPMAAGSPFFKTLPLGAHGLRWVHPPAPLAHPLDDGSAVIVERSVRETARGLGPDARAYGAMFASLSGRWDDLAGDILGPPGLPAHPGLLARFGMSALRSASALARGRFRGARAQALFAGLASHSFLPLEAPASAAFGIVLGALAHAVGWPIAEGGSQRIADALAAHLRSLGGNLATGAGVRSLGDLPPADLVMLDVTPRQLLSMDGGRDNPLRRRLGAYRYGPGVFKADWALSSPVPWRAAECRRAGTVHLGGTLEQIASAESEVAGGGFPAQPFVLFAQPTLFDPSRAPAGRHTAWAYCHVPNGWQGDALAAIEAQVERFAPGFRDCILARHVATPATLEAMNANYVGGDICGGSNSLSQLFTRPVVQGVPYRTGLRGVYLCSSSTPPGGGVHGMCGWNAAQAALRDLRRAA
ncbi:MAG TPA: NAD(P)/FAD-dependent oxidoreductase [Opitutaceae bacterium]|jgi:phytoene dehydrogenase-like protein